MPKRRKDAKFGKGRLLVISTASTKLDKLRERSHAEPSHPLGITGLDSFTFASLRLGERYSESSLADWPRYTGLVKK